MDIAEGASVPALGLSNKAVYAGSETQPCISENNGRQSDDQYAESYFSPQHLTGNSSSLLNFKFLVFTVYAYQWLLKSFQGLRVIV